MPTATQELLIVEDDTAISDLLATIFHDSLQCNVTQVATVEAALEVLDQGPVDLITLDLILPETNGTDLLVELDKRQAETPVLVISASNITLDLQTYPFVEAVISKPFDIDELLNVVQSSLLKSSQRLERGQRRVQQTQQRMVRGQQRVEQTQQQIENSLDKLKATKNFLSTPDQP